MLNKKFIPIICVFILIFQAFLIINPIKTEAAVDIPNSFSGRGSLTQTSAQGGNFSGYASITSGLPASAKGTSGSFSINCLDPTAGDIKEVGVSTTGGSYTATKQSGPDSNGWVTYYVTFNYVDNRTMAWELGYIRDENGLLMGCQRFGGTVRVQFEISGRPRLQKVSDNPAATSTYPLQNAEFTIYKDQACTQIAKDINGNNAILTTDINGLTPRIDLEPGIYYVKETKAPNGYQKTNQITNLNVQSGQETTTNILNKINPGKGKVVKSF